MLRLSKLLPRMVIHLLSIRNKRHVFIVFSNLANRWNLRKARCTAKTRLNYRKDNMHWVGCMLTPACRGLIAGKRRQEMATPRWLLSTHPLASAFSNAWKIGTAVQDKPPLSIQQQSKTLIKLPFPQSICTSPFTFIGASLSEPHTALAWLHLRKLCVCSACGHIP